MPYYQQGPEDYYGPQSGFDPYSGRLQGGQLVMQFLQNLQRQRDEKQQREWAGEDRELQRENVRSQIADRNKPNTYNLTDFERRLALLLKDPETYYKMYPQPAEKLSPEETAYGSAKGRIKAENEFGVSDEAKETYQDKKRIYEQNRKERAASVKKHGEDMIKLSAIDKRINEIKLKRTKAMSAQDPAAFASLSQEVERLSSERTVLQAQIDATLESLSTPEQKPTKPEESKTIGGVKYYRWSDGKWYPSKEGLQTTK